MPGHSRLRRERVRRRLIAAAGAAIVVALAAPAWRQELPPGSGPRQTIPTHSRDPDAANRPAASRPRLQEATLAAAAPDARPFAAARSEPDLSPLTDWVEVLWAEETDLERQYSALLSVWPASGAVRRLVPYVEPAAVDEGTEDVAVAALRVEVGRATHRIAWLCGAIASLRESYSLRGEPR
jgi:hypothetical protein